MRKTFDKFSIWGFNHALRMVKNNNPSSEHCPMKDKCYRVSAKPNKFAQSWSNFEYTCNDNSGFNKYISQKH